MYANPVIKFTDLNGEEHNYVVTQIHNIIEGGHFRVIETKDKSGNSYTYTNKSLIDLHNEMIDSINYARKVNAPKSQEEAENKLKEIQEMVKACKG